MLLGPEEEREFEAALLFPLARCVGLEKFVLDEFELRLFDAVVVLRVLGAKLVLRSELRFRSSDARVRRRS